MQKCTDLNKINVFLSQNVDLTPLEAYISGAIHMLQAH